jgi:hypothetical protein
MLHSRLSITKLLYGTSFGWCPTGPSFPFTRDLHLAALIRLSSTIAVASCLLLVAAPTTLQGQENGEVTPKDKLIIETVLRLQNFDLDSSAPAKAAVMRYLHAEQGSERYFELIERFQPVEIVESLVQYCHLHSHGPCHESSRSAPSAHLAQGPAAAESLVDRTHDRRSSASNPEGESRWVQK